MTGWARRGLALTLGLLATAAHADPWTVSAPAGPGGSAAAVVLQRPVPETAAAEPLSPAVPVRGGVVLARPVPLGGLVPGRPAVLRCQAAEGDAGPNAPDQPNRMFTWQPPQDENLAAPN